MPPLQRILDKDYGDVVLIDGACYSSKQPTVDPVDTPAPTQSFSDCAECQSGLSSSDTQSSDSSLSSALSSDLSSVISSDSSQEVSSNASSQEVSSSSPIPPCPTVCIASDWDTADLNGTYTYNSGNQRWEQDNGDAYILDNGISWTLFHPLSDAGDDSVYSSVGDFPDHCPANESTWVFNVLNAGGTQSFFTITEGDCPSSSQDSSSIQESSSLEDSSSIQDSSSTLTSSTQDSSAVQDSSATQDSSDTQSSADQTSSSTALCVYSKCPSSSTESSSISESSSAPQSSSSGTSSEVSSETSVPSVAPSSSAISSSGPEAWIYTPCESSSSGVATCACVEPGSGIWLCAEDIGLNDLDPIPQWDDLSGNGNNGVPNSVPDSPIYLTNVLNGFPVVDFQGADNLVVPHDASINVTTGHTGFAVLKPDSAGGFIFSKGQPATTGAFYVDLNAAKLRFSADTTLSNFKNISTIANLSTVNYTVVSWRLDGTEMLIWFNSVLQSVTTSSGGTLGTVENADPVVIGEAQDFAGLPNGSHYDGKMADFIYFNSAENRTVMGAIEACLMDKYGL